MHIVHLVNGCNNSYKRKLQLVLYKRGQAQSDLYFLEKRLELIEEKFVEGR